MSSGKRDEERYRQAIHAGLGRAFADAATPVLELDAQADRLVLFSDHHKGARDGADDFRRCERAYNAALAHYFALGHRLVVLGDAEELWECDPQEVIPRYGRTYELERDFNAEGRYVRVWGNHDDQWRHAAEVTRHLRPVLGDVVVHEALKLVVRRRDGGEGLLFLVHGHQGTLESDKLGWLARLPVRFVWRNIQRWTKIPSTTPAKDWELRERHDRAMFEWARSHPAHPVLVAGHTHRPVFAGSRPTPKVARGAAAVDRELREREAAGLPGEERARLVAEREFAAAEARRIDPPTVPNVPPCYFNTGCCSFGDGDVTGLEIAGGELRLVRWPDDDRRPVPQVLAAARLEEILDAVAGGPAAPVPSTVGV